MSGPVTVAAMVVLALFAVILIVSAAIAPDGSSTQSGVYGYLLLQATGILGFLAHSERRGVAWAARALAALFVVNLVHFLAIDAGLLGPQIVLIALNLVLIAFSGGLGVIAVGLALSWTVSGGPRAPSMIPAVTTLMVATLLVGSALAGDGSRPPPPADTAATSPRPIVTPTATPTATPTVPPPRTFPLVLRVAGNGSVLIRSDGLTCAGTCTFSIGEGRLVTLTAQPGPDSVFANWAGCRIPCQIRMDQERQVTATFRLPVLRTSVIGKARGAVRSAPAGIACPPTCEAPFARGTRVTLTATPEGSAGFTGWTEACAGFATCIVQIRADTPTTAQFETLAPRPEFMASPCDETSPIQIRRDETKTLLVCFQNAGKATWTRAKPTEVEIAQCCPLGGPSPLKEWAVGWTSPSVYADLQAAEVVPGQQGFAVFNVRAPTNAPFGDHRFDGFLVHSGSGAPVDGGAFSIVVTVIR